MDCGVIPHFLKNLDSLSFLYSKRASSPSKTEVPHKKICLFWLKKTSQTRKKQKFCMTKWQKNRQKSSQKEHPAPQKLYFCQKKIVFFYSKIPPSPAKNWNFARKNDQKMTKKFPQKSTQPRKNLKFCMKNWKSSYLWGFWKKKSRPPTSPNF